MTSRAVTTPCTESYSSSESCSQIASVAAGSSVLWCRSAVRYVCCELDVCSSPRGLGVAGVRIGLPEEDGACLALLESLREVCLEAGVVIDHAHETRRFDGVLERFRDDERDRLTFVEHGIRLQRQQLLSDRQR